MWPPAKTMIMRAEPIAIGASGPALGGITVLPTVKTRKKVPMNSTRHFFIGFGRLEPKSSGKTNAFSAPAFRLPRGGRIVFQSGMTWESLVNPMVLKQPVYEPGKPIEDVAREMGLDPEGIVKLASNENPHGPSPRALEAARRAL